MTEKIVSGPPKVVLQKWFQNPYADAIAAARTCYSPRVIADTEVEEVHKERIGKTTFEGGHHTVYTHATFKFGLENVSRQFVWSFLHAHPFYNSEQSIQRYVKLNEVKVTVPPLDAANKKVFERACRGAWQAYRELTAILLEDLKDDYLKRFPKKELTDKDLKKLEKKSIETARYVVPIAAHTSMVHTLNGITLYRLYRLMNQLPTSWEASVVVGRMVEEVKKVDPDFFRNVEDPLPLEETLEFKAVQALKQGSSQEFIREFDAELGGYTSKLVAFSPDAERITADAVRAVLGKSKQELGDDAALDMLVNPAKNKYLGSSLDLATISPLMRCLNHAHFSFKKKLSHAADSQDQRHRMVPASRPVLSLAVSGQPDYITPPQIARNEKAKQVYDAWMGKAWDYARQLTTNGVPKEHAVYLLPNALAVRFIESGSLLNLWHKWVMRLCLNAQREIWVNSVEEFEQVSKVAPRLVKFLGPPCQVRKTAEITPWCNEGKLFCGYPVWGWGPLVETGKRPV